MSNSYQFDQIINSKDEYNQNLYDQGANTYNSLAPSGFSADENLQLFKQPSRNFGVIISGLHSGVARNQY